MVVDLSAGPWDFKKEIFRRQGKRVTTRLGSKKNIGEIGEMDNRLLKR